MSQKMVLHLKYSGAYHLLSFTNSHNLCKNKVSFQQESKSLYTDRDFLEKSDKIAESDKALFRKINGLVSKLIREGYPELKSAFKDLLDGRSIQCCIDEQIIYDQLEHTEDAIWSLLLASGYLKISHYDQADRSNDTPKGKYELVLTNHEVKLMFLNIVKDWFSSTSHNYNAFIRSLLNDDLEAMNAYMNDITLSIFSYFDVGSGSKRSQTENFYHGFVLGLMVKLQDRYHITSNRESGFGRYDVVLEPRRPDLDAMILEFKVFNERKEKTLEDTVATALQQIEDKQYAASLIAKGIPEEKIRRYGFAFDGKIVLIG